MRSRILPFAAFIAVIALEQALTYVFPSVEAWHVWFYPLRVLAALVALVLCWSDYDELRERSEPVHLLLAAGVGVAVYLIWIISRETVILFV